MRVSVRRETFENHVRKEEKGPYWFKWGESKLVRMCCGNGHVSSFRIHDHVHKIDIEGNVDPGVICPRPRCEWTASVKLENWCNG